MERAKPAARMAKAGPTALPELAYSFFPALAAAINSRNSGWALLDRGDASRPAQYAPSGSPPHGGGNRRRMAKAGPTALPEPVYSFFPALAAAINSRNSGWAL